MYLWQEDSKQARLFGPWSAQQTYPRTSFLDLSDPFYLLDPAITEASEFYLLFRGEIWTPLMYSIWYVRT